MSIQKIIKEAKHEEARNEIINFIKDEGKHEICINKKYLLMKHLYKDNAFLYLKNICRDTKSILKSNYEYGGFYNLILNKFYDLKSMLSNLISIKNEFDLKKLEIQIIGGIKQKLSEELITNNQKYFKEPFKLDEKLNNELK